jgi:hypothetical protein
MFCLSLVIFISSVTFCVFSQSTFLPLWVSFMPHERGRPKRASESLSLVQSSPLTTCLSLVVILFIICKWSLVLLTRPPLILRQDPPSLYLPPPLPSSLSPSMLKPQALISFYLPTLFSQRKNATLFRLSSMTMLSRSFGKNSWKSAWTSYWILEQWIPSKGVERRKLFRVSWF